MSVLGNEVPPHMEVTHDAFTAFIRSMPPRSHRISLSLRKLSKFSDIHLIELSTDIYDELRRRQSPAAIPGGNLPIKSGIHPQRNDARRKLGSLSFERFGDMCKDIVAEQERRYPQLAVRKGGFIDEFIDEPGAIDSLAPQGIMATTPRLDTFGSPYPNSDLIASPVNERNSIQFSLKSNHSALSATQNPEKRDSANGKVGSQPQVVKASVTHVKTQMMVSDSGSDEEIDRLSDDGHLSNQNSFILNTREKLGNNYGPAMPEYGRPASTMSELSALSIVKSRSNSGDGSTRSSKGSKGSKGSESSKGSEGRGSKESSKGSKGSKDSKDSSKNRIPTGLRNSDQLNDGSHDYNHNDNTKEVVPQIPFRMRSHSPQSASDVDYEDFTPPPAAQAAQKPSSTSFMFDDDIEHSPRHWSEAETGPVLRDLSENEPSEDDLNEEPGMISRSAHLSPPSLNVNPQKTKPDNDEPEVSSHLEPKLKEIQLGQDLSEKEDEDPKEVVPDTVQDDATNDDQPSKNIESTSLESHQNSDTQNRELSDQTPACLNQLEESLAHFKSHNQVLEQRITEANSQIEDLRLNLEDATTKTSTTEARLAELEALHSSTLKRSADAEARILELEQLQRVAQQNAAAADLRAEQVEHALVEAKERALAAESQTESAKLEVLNMHNKALSAPIDKNSSEDMQGPSKLLEEHEALKAECELLKEQLSALQAIVHEQHEDLTRAPTVHRAADENVVAPRMVEPHTGLMTSTASANADVQLMKDYSDLQNRYDALQDELSSQQAITTRVRQEAAMFLGEMRELAQKQTNEAKDKMPDNVSSEELLARIKSLTIEAQEWRMKYVDSLGELKKLRGIHRSSMLPTVLRFLGGPTIHKPTGLLSESIIVELQGALDDFLLNARDDKRRGEILSDLHRVILATRGIVAEAKTHDPRFVDEIKLISRTANQMISVVRNFSVSSGLLPLTLVDAACSDLAVSVIELVKVAGIRDSTILPSRSITPVRHSMHLEEASSAMNSKHQTEPNATATPESTSTVDNPGTPLSTSSPQFSTPKNQEEPAIVGTQRPRSATSPSIPQASASKDTAGISGSTSIDALNVPRTRQNTKRKSMSARFSAVPAIPPPQVPEGARRSHLHESWQRAPDAEPSSNSSRLSLQAHEQSVSPQPSVSESMSFDQIVMGGSPENDSTYVQKSSPEYPSNTADSRVPAFAQFGAPLGSSQNARSPPSRSPVRKPVPSLQSVESSQETRTSLKSGKENTAGYTSPVAHAEPVGVGSELPTNGASPERQHLRTKSDLEPTTRRMSTASPKQPEPETASQSQDSSHMDRGQTPEQNSVQNSIELNVSPTTADAGEITHVETARFNSPRLASSAEPEPLITAPKRRQRPAPRVRDIEVDASIAKLQSYLEEQTSETIDATSSLLSGIKENAAAGVLKPLIDTIIEFVNQMIDATGSTMVGSSNSLLRHKGMFILENLRDCSLRMDALFDEVQRLRDDATLSRATKQRIAGCAFDMAKCTKELVKTVEEVSIRSELEQIDQVLA